MDSHIDLTESLIFARPNEQFAGIIADIRGTRTPWGVPELRAMFPELDPETIYSFQRSLQIELEGNSETRLSKLGEYLYNSSCTCDRCGKDLSKRPYDRVFSLCHTCFEDMLFGDPIYRRKGWEGSFIPL